MNAEMGPGGHLEGSKICSGSLLPLGSILEGSQRFSGSHFGVNFGSLFRAKTGQEPFPTSFFRLLRLPRALPEALQRLSEGLRVEDVILNQFWTGLGSDFGDPDL